MKIAIGLAAASTAAAAAAAAVFARGRRQRKRGSSGGAELAPAIIATPNARLALPQPSLHADGDAISVVTYNVLADACAGKHASYCPAEHLAWPYRWQLLQTSLAGWDADIVMLQELTPAMLADVRAWAAESGGTYAVAAQGDERGRKPSLCATLFKARRFALWYEDDRRSRAHCCALLYSDGSGATQALYVVNVHLEGHPDKAAERLLQLRGALASAAKHQEAEGLPPDACSVVVGGDFNENVTGVGGGGFGSDVTGGGGGGGVRHLLTHGWATLPPQAVGNGGGGSGAGSKTGSMSSLAALDAAAATAAPTEVTQPYLLRDAYARAPLPYTRCLPRGRAAHIDGLFASAHARGVAVLHAQRPEDARLGMPHAEAPSDHLPLGAVLVWPRAAAAAAGGGG